MENLNTLILCGGKSSRMGKDKSMLVYFDKPQCYYLYDLLKPFSNETFISCNKNQVKTISEKYKTIIDSEMYKNTGPMAALLSAFALYPTHNFLVIACDYPFINVNDIQQLLDSKDEKYLAVCFYNYQTHFEEPLLAIYSSDCYPLLLNEFKSNNFSLRNFLQKINAKKIIPYSPESLMSIDTENDYIHAKQKLNINDD